ncbi:fructose repressor [Salmonella enterica subsp. arizonae]|uniref:Catabolite repressor/activator n=1 Tax=Salmonella enterica subsp. arizonae TaxID=59203 RepID=A0A379S9F7_SALER|nr:fructose repressor [Salmonella enterica subsp. arizonae]
MKLDEIARLAGVSRTTASYVINGKAKQYRVSDKTVEKVMAVVREHNYHPTCCGCRATCWTHTFHWSGDPDLENTSYTRIANYLERQARQRGYQLLIACSEDQPDNEMRCIEHLLQRQVDAIIVSTSLPPEHPFYQRWANDSFPIVALDRALDREHFTSVVGADQDDAEMLAEELRKFPAETVLYLGALPELSVSFLREQGFRTAWKDDPREVNFLYANSYEREAAAQLFEKWLETHPMPQALFTTSFALLQGVMDVTLRRDGKLPSDLAIATFGDHELLDFLQCPVLAVAQRHRDVAERVLEIVLASLDEPRKPKPGLTRIRRNLYRRGILSRS